MQISTAILLAALVQLTTGYGIFFLPNAVVSKVRLSKVLLSELSKLIYK